MAASVSRVTLPLSHATRQKSSMLPDSRNAMYAWQMAMSSGLVFWCCSRAKKGRSAGFGTGLVFWWCCAEQGTAVSRVQQSRGERHARHDPSS